MKLIWVVFLIYSIHLHGQDETDSLWEDETQEVSDLRGETFSTTRVINGHSVETLSKKVLDFRIEHRFGDVAGENGGVQNMFGFDNAADIRFGFEYGLTDNLMIGIGRSKGTGVPYRSLLDGFAKYRFLTQGKNNAAFSMTAIGSGFYSYMKASADSFEVSNFPKTAHRFAYSFQLNLARKFGSRLSLMLAPTLVHRNYVAFDDVNTLFSIGSAFRFAVTPRVGLITEYYYVINPDDTKRSDNTNSLGVAVEWTTFGHTFAINFTNSKGFGEAQFIPGTFEDWLKGQFRIGFSVGRKFMWE